MNINTRIIRTVAIFFVALFFITVTLFSANDVMLSNNGDYNRVMRLCSLQKDDDGEVKIVLTGDGFLQNFSNILFTPSDIRAYPSSQLAFTRTAVAMNFIINNLTGMPLDNYNFSCLGILMSILYALAVAFFLSQIKIKNKVLDAIMVLIALVVLCDIGYVSYFNSLYAEGIQHTLLIITIGFFLVLTKRKFTIYELVVFALVLVLYGQSKFFNIPIAVIMCLAFFALSLRHNLQKKEIVFNLTVVLLVTGILFSTMAFMPKWINNETNYNSIFYGVVKDCDDDVAKDYLENDLGLDAELHVLKNTHHYVSNFLEIDAKYNLKQAKDISKIKFVLFYLSHPLVTINKVQDISQHSGAIRNIFFMDENYMNDWQRLTYWSGIRENSGFDTVFLNLLIVALFLMIFVCFFRKTNTSNYITVISSSLIAIIFLYAFFVPYASNGEADLAKHMFAFCEFIDIALVFILVAVFNSKNKVRMIFSLCLVIMLIVNILPGAKTETVSFGGYEWYVIDRNSEYETLMAKDIVAKRAYNGFDDNNYERSDIHKWLNGEFLSGFSQQERDRMLLKEEKIILSRTHVGEATEGTRDFYCVAYPNRFESNYETAYSKTVSGYVFLPTAQHISMMAKKGYDVTSKEKFWTSTPYFNNVQEQRYVNPDGLVYFEYCSEELGIRPIIYKKTDQQ